MSYTRDIVILTKSSKKGGFCVSGIDIDTNEWVRPVLPFRPIYANDMCCGEDYICQPLDVVRITFKSPCPNGCQSENECIDTTVQWEFLYRYSLSDVLKIHPAENYHTIFGNTECVLNEYEKNNCDFSLMLIKVYNLNFFTSVDSRKTKANFIYNGIAYNYMSVTDRDFYNNENSYESAYLVISIPNEVPENMNYFKFISKVFIDE